MNEFLTPSPEVIETNAVALARTKENENPHGKWQFNKWES